MAPEQQLFPHQMRRQLDPVFSALRADSQE
jgi:hypothetical protein